MQRTFDLDRANALLPALRAALRQSAQLAVQLRALTRKHGVDAPADIDDEDALAQATLLTELWADEGRRLSRLGVVVRDREDGHVDFPSVLDGEREVLLCWRVGETEVGHFHEVHGGCASRRSTSGHVFFDRRQLAPPRG